MRSLAHSLPLLVFLVGVSTAVDLCALFGLCNNQNNNQNNRREFNNNNNNNNNPSSSAVRQQIDGTDWHGATANAVKLYHFSSGNGPMTWADADRYCERKGGYLAEPKSSAEHNFLRNFVSRFGNNNWWLGMRLAEDCTCQASGRASFDATLDTSSLNNGRNGLVQTRCPSNFNKRCNGGRRVWRWSFSGERVRFTVWNQQTGEPHGSRGSPEFCATMWTKAGFNWGDWGCDIRIDAGHPFKAICERDASVEEEVDSGEYETGDYEYNYNENNEPREQQNQDSEACLSRDLTYRSVKTNRLEAILGVGSHQECRRQCARNVLCTHWNWRGDKGNQPCALLTGGALRSNRKTVQGAFAGSMSARCKASVSQELIKLNKQDKSYCVEYGVAYSGGDRLRFIKGTSSPDDCRRRCGQTDGCAFWSRRGKEGQERCHLMSAAREYTRNVNGKAVSGSILGRCGRGQLRGMQACTCQQAPPKAERNRNNNNRRPNRNQNNNNNDDSDDEDYDYAYDDRDLVGEGLIDVRISNDPGVGVELIECPRRQIRQCDRGSRPVVTTTTVAPTRPVGGKRSDVCADYDVQYSGSTGADVIRRYNNVPNADVCRSRCLQQPNSVCRAWTWQGPNARRRRCVLLRTDTYTYSYKEGAVSGTVSGECGRLALSQLRTCTCKNVNDLVGSGDDDDYDYYDYRDLVGEGAIDVRINGGDSSCGSQQALRCVAEGASATIGTRGSFGGGGGVGTRTGITSTSNTDSSRVIFGRK